METPKHDLIMDLIDKYASKGVTKSYVEVYEEVNNVDLSEIGAQFYKNIDSPVVIKDFDDVKSENEIEEAGQLSDEDLELIFEIDSRLPVAPWVVWDDGDIGTDYPVTYQRRDRRTGEMAIEAVESKWLFNGSGENSADVVALRNLLPALLDRLSAAESRVEELEKILEDQKPPF